jgi:hypothetical protein
MHACLLGTKGKEENLQRLRGFGRTWDFRRMGPEWGSWVPERQYVPDRIGEFRTTHSTSRQSCSRGEYTEVNCNVFLVLDIVN